MPWTVTVEKSALRGLSRIPKGERERIGAVLASMEADPFGGDLKYLRNDPRGAYRRRVGSWRIIFDADTQGHMIDVKAITRRTSTTY